mmetsp:Transcript_30394/g.66862  ORF Transcript_30394/g.66862 Transcript_30394/m.66862 type:complete len:154 (-) Transcript_30394:52-513(-)
MPSTSSPISMCLGMLPDVAMLINTQSPSPLCAAATSSLASAVATSCKLCCENGEQWVDDTEALRQCVTRLLASHAGGFEQRWAFVAGFRIGNLSHINPHRLRRSKPPVESCDSLHVSSVEWFQGWLRSCSPDVAITDADVKRGTRHYYPKRSN